MQFVKSLLRNYYQKLCLSNEVEMQSIIREFKEISGFPQAVGAIDGCHIRIKSSLKDAEDYIN